MTYFRAPGPLKTKNKKRARGTGEEAMAACHIYEVVGDIIKLQTYKARFLTALLHRHVK